jgi:hypothetical protein
MQYKLINKFNLKNEKIEILKIINIKFIIKVLNIFHISNGVLIEKPDY